MSKSMQEALGLPVLDDLLLGGEQNQPAVVEEDDSDQIAVIDDSTLPKESTLEKKDTIANAEFERDTTSIYSEAMKHASDLMALGYNVDTRSASKIFDTAASMLKIALDASTTKRDGQLKKARLLLDEKKTNYLTSGRADPVGEGDVQVVEARTVANRNDLIKQMRNQD